MTNRSKVQQFLQLNHSHAFGLDYLHGYFDIPIPEMAEICEQIIACGAAKRPEYTKYIVGIPVDWAAVHEGRAERPEWSIEPTYAESLRRCADALKQIEASLAPHLEPRKCLIDGSDCGSTLCPPAEDEQEELLDEPGPDVVEYWGTPRQI